MKVVKKSGFVGAFHHVSKNISRSIWQNLTIAILTVKLLMGSGRLTV